MEGKRKRPALGRRETGRKKLKYQNRRFENNTKPAEISTFTAKKILHDIYITVERRSEPMVHLRPDPRPGRMTG